jgi:hypothetical protein
MFTLEVVRTQDEKNSSRRQTFLNVHYLVGMILELYKCLHSYKKLNMKIMSKSE